MKIAVKEKSVKYVTHKSIASKLNFEKKNTNKKNVK